jgi:hypothetical protein
MTFDPDWKDRTETETRVVNLRRESYDVYIGRKSPFGNPFTHMKGPTLAEYIVETREQAIDEFKKYFLKRVEEDIEFRAKVMALKGKTLGCFCAPLSCHGNVIAEWLDNQPNL